MISNLEKYKKDLDRLVSDGDNLLNALQFECYPAESKLQLKKILPELEENKETLEKACDEFIKTLPSFRFKYQFWYSESLAIIKLLLPDRLSDFVRLYEKPKNRKIIEYGNYVIEDCLQGLTVTTVFREKKVGPEAGIPQFQQQLNILKSVRKRFESSLFDIRQLVQADLFDSELEAAKELNKKGFVRGAGAIAGVVLEMHLSQVCDNHAVKIKGKKPSVADYNDKLKEAEVYDTATWRKIQHLGDLRNLCDHKKKKDPTIEDVEELITGVEKIIKTLF
jgi:hypothetical protein